MQILLNRIAGRALYVGKEARRRYAEAHPEVKERKAEKQRERMKDPVKKKRKNDQTREARNADPNYKGKRNALKNKPKYREKARNRARQRLLDPVYNEKVNSQRREKAKDPERKRKRVEQRQRGRKKASATALVYQTLKRKTDPSFKMRMALSNRLVSALKSQGLRKTLTTMNLVSCNSGCIQDTY